ncbi:YdiK family protein [Salisediminibacterium halotolerans]|uniref:DUF4305 domain-containing protein n=1 Tax=Salisediminibacterium halotolerans TaxID=517425 RepID=A0A1H9TCG9_9BACI|nr:YdiK family protein [Salisediminibacterium haloalkalitolerans]SER94489.1 protein of unknown function [Salisediminibacterium haloalkalitolerans]
MVKSPRFMGLMYFTLGTVFLFLAIQWAGTETGWDFMTVLLMIFAALDYFIAFRYFGAARQQADKKE